MPRYQAEGMDFGYTEFGEGPALVLIHGWGASGQEWHEVGWVSAVGEGRRLLIPDVRGHGSSAKPHEAEAYAPARLGQDVLALLDAAGVEEADLLGYSMGAAIALWAVLLAPHRVRSLVVGGVPDEDVDARVAAGKALRGNGPMTPRAREYQGWALAQPGNDLLALAACLEGGLELPPYEELAVFGGEAFVAAGTLDRRFDAGQRLASRLPGGRFLALEGDDHMGAFEDVRLHDAVREFLAEVSPL